MLLQSGGMLSRMNRLLERKWHGGGPSSGGKLDVWFVKAWWRLDNRVGFRHRWRRMCIKFATKLNLSRIVFPTVLAGEVEPWIDCARMLELLLLKLVILTMFSTAKSIFKLL